MKCLKMRLNARATYFSLTHPLCDLQKQFKLYKAMNEDSLVINYKIDVGLSLNHAYYNAGVVLFNMGEWKKQHCTERIVEHVKNIRAHYPAQDQDLINVVIKDDIYELPPE